MLAVTTFSLDIAGLELYLPLITGARIVIATREEATDGARLARLLASSKATVMQATPATWRMLRAAGWIRTPGLTVLCGGEALPGRLAADLLRAASDVWNLYGPTETTIWSTLLRVDNVDDVPSAWETIPTVSIGRPIGNTTVYILDRHGNPMPLGCPGELYIGGAGVARGYLNLPALTAERFVPDPFGVARQAADSIARAIARRAGDGSIEFLGKRSPGQAPRVPDRAGEIESVLLRHPSIREAVVVAAGSDDDRTIVAYVVGAGTADQTDQQDGGIDRAALRAHLAASLPDYMIPSMIVPLDRIPLTPNGKCDRRALPRPDRPAILGPRAIVPPRDERERTIRATSGRPSSRSTKWESTTTSSSWAATACVRRARPTSCSACSACT